MKLPRTKKHRQYSVADASISLFNQPPYTFFGRHGQSFVGCLWMISTDRFMDIVDEIQEKIENMQFEFSQHAVDQSLIRRISVQEIREAILHSELIEDYPDDKYGPSCLLHGFTTSLRPLHIQCSHPSRPVIKIITVYEPNPSRWIDFKERRRGDA